MFGALRHRPSKCSNKADNVDENTADVSCVSAPVEAGGEVVGVCFAGGVEVLDLVVPAANDVIVADDDACDRGEEDRVSR